MDLTFLWLDRSHSVSSAYPVPVQLACRLCFCRVLFSSVMGIFMQLLSDLSLILLVCDEPSLTVVCFNVS